MVEFFLFVCITGSAAGTPNYLCKQHKMPSLDVCLRSVQVMQIAPTNATADKDTRVFAYCAPEGGWHQPK